MSLEEFLLTLWQRLFAGFAQAPPLQPSLPELGLAALVATLATLPNVIWKVFGVFLTIVHECGHAAAAMMTGRWVTGIKIRLDQSGETRAYGRVEGPGVAWTLFFGYPAPAILGSGILWAALAGWAPAALSLGSLILVAGLAAIRNWAGLLVTAGVAGVAGVLVWFGSAIVVGQFTLALGLALLAGAVRAWLNLARIHAHRPDELETSDAFMLAQATGTPAGMWLSLFAASIFASSVFGGITLAGSLLLA